MKVNEQIRAKNIRVIDANGNQVGIITLSEGLRLADEQKLDLVEVAPLANPPVCKVINYGKFRYDQTKREKESKKSQHLIKIKEVKIKPNISVHDLGVKIKRARDFIAKQFKVKVTCMFRGREMAHQEVGQQQMEKFYKELEDIAIVESNAKMLGRNLTMVLAPNPKKQK